jgi:hypothetical protein
MRTYLVSKITEGISNSAVALCTFISLNGLSTVAFWFKTSKSARRKETTPNGS